MKSIKLGKKVKDSITGFTGIATAITEHLYGCIRVCVESKTLKEKDSHESIELWFDEQRLIPKSEAPPGGPQKTPTKFKQEKRR